METTIAQRTKLFALEQLTYNRAKSTEDIDKAQLTIEESTIIKDLYELNVDNDSINEYITRGVAELTEMRLYEYS